MLTAVLFISRETAERYLVSNGNTAVISITDPSQALANLPAKLHSILRIAFTDLYEESLGVPLGLIPDIHQNPGIGLYYAENKHKFVDARDAYSIYEFIKNLQQIQAHVELVVHCEAGISRSAAIAKFVHETYAVPITSCNTDTSNANLRVLRLLTKVHTGAPLISGEVDAKQLQYHMDRTPKKEYAPFHW